MKAGLEREQRLFQRGDIAVSDVAPGQEYAYRPGLCVVAGEDLALIAAELAAIGAEPATKRVAAPSGTVAYRVPADVDIPTLVARLRAVDADRTPRVGPAHVFFGAPRFIG